MTEPVDLSSVLDTLSGIQRSLESLNAAPNPVDPAAAPATKGVEDAPVAQPSSRKLLSMEEMTELKDQIRFKPNGSLRSVGELQSLFIQQANRQDTGVPLAAWANSGGYATQVAMQQNPMIQKALDSSGAGALIRQDLEPVLQELFIREFPAYERFGRVPANGLVHAYDQVTSFGSAVFMPELGTVTDDTSVYARQTTNVAILATRRGISFKAGFAVAAGGMSWDPAALEMQGGLRAIAHELQKAIFQGNSTNSGGTGSSEDGLYDANAFTGLRSILNTGRAKNVDPTLSTPEDMRAAIDRACEEIVEQGGRASILWCHPHEKVTFDLQQDANVRYMNQFVDVAVGVQTNAVNTVFGPLPLAVVPGDSIGTYTNSGTRRDIYALDESSISLPYLGSEGPTVLEIPPGVAGQLTRLFIIFGMWGLAVRAIPFSNKIRVKQ